MSTRGSQRALSGTLVLVLALAAPSFVSRAASAEETASTLSPPPLTVSLTPAGGGASWKLRVENTGDVPVRIAADPRLLVLEVTPPAGFVDPTAPKNKRAGAASKKVDDAKPVRCMLPDDARPSTDEGRDLVVPSKRSWSTSIDPLMYCFGARERATLVAGATVKASFGWPAPPVKAGARAPKKPVPFAPPFVAAPVGAAIGKIAPAKDLQATPFTLADDATPAPAAPAAPATPPAPGAASLTITMPEALDVARGIEVPTTVTVANDGDKAAVLLFRPSTVRFTVAGPAGSYTCGTTRRIESPIRELFSTIGVKGRATIAMLLTGMCPADTFDEPGIYRVTPVLDTSGASGRSLGLKTWDGVVSGQTPMLLRVRSARRAPAGADRTRPALD